MPMPLELSYDYELSIAAWGFIYVSKRHSYQYIDEFICEYTYFEEGLAMLPMDLQEVFFYNLDLFLSTNENKLGIY